jgi:hypothetical protein
VLAVDKNAADTVLLNNVRKVRNLVPSRTSCYVFEVEREMGRIDEE